ncbi:hypothetical protein Geob_0862 [Geotalea daltonii FRC-32]|uniref:DUF2231 domain-containing protein n=1 Tax=Geotalea daltonii (strain DSM 22248 / JCM 15807 / FRC-32) TaxID=316067 RepID=B9M1S8_GEODF|nr:DUF2231 domain-containing protein [Geotalea daltonii]ACM19224.1 hypothetical protein Geob_0862 [Geotalea daltonii FRC-32]
MIATANIAKHPLHPMLIPLAIGLWIFSLACDIIFFATGDVTWRTTSLYAIGGGVIGALIAALPGFVDLFTLHASPEKKLGIWHMAINLTIVIIYVIEFLWRRADPGNIGQFALSVMAVLLLAISGWLGGEMVYVYGTGVDPACRHKL